MNMPPSITTPSLLLRAIELSDAQRMFDNYSQDPEVARYMSWRLTGNFQDTLSFVTSAVSWWEKPETAADFVYSIFVADSMEFIGTCSAGPHHGTSTYHWGMGYNLARRFWGQGYGTEAVSALTNTVMQQAEVFRVSAVVDVENGASARVLEKSGFQREGILRRYGMHPNASAEPRDVFIYSKVK
jgi:RimJ/RimL family protein N-acetyltransferase